jgi:hypothetical protein
MIGSARAGPLPRGIAAGRNLAHLKCAHSRARPKSCVFPLTWTFMAVGRLFALDGRLPCIRLSQFSCRPSQESCYNVATLLH